LITRASDSYRPSKVSVAKSRENQGPFYEFDFSEDRRSDVLPGNYRCHGAWPDSGWHSEPNTFAEPDGFAQSDSFTESDGFAQSNSFTQSDGVAQPNSFAQSNSFTESDRNSKSNAKESRFQRGW
jgi:hypothetical protein